MKCPNFIIEKDDHESITIRDLGPWDEFPTVTNNAEEVIEKLVRAGRLPSVGSNKRFFYYDSDGILDELLVKDGCFSGFAPGPMGGK